MNARKIVCASVRQKKSQGTKERTSERQANRQTGRKREPKEERKNEKRGGGEEFARLAPYDGVDGVRDVVVA